MELIEVFSQKPKCPICHSEKRRHPEASPSKDNFTIKYECGECYSLVYVYVDVNDETGTISIKTGAVGITNEEEYKKRRGEFNIWP